MPALSFFVSTLRYMRFGLLGAMAMPMRERPSSAVGKPCVIGRQVLPPSVDLYKPLPGMMKDSPLRTSQGATRAAQSAANRTCGSLGSITTSAAPVFSSL